MITMEQYIYIVYPIENMIAWMIFTDFSTIPLKKTFKAGILIKVIFKLEKSSLVATF